MNQEDLEKLGLPSLKDPHLRHLRQLFLAVVTGGTVVMVPWIVYLADSLPQTHSAKAWKVAWVGFDIALTSGLFGTAWAAWRRRQILVPFALATATLLICDAWFDVTLDWGTGDEIGSALSATLVEGPLALYLIWSALRIIRLTIRSAMLITGHGETPIKFFKLSIGALSELVAPVDKA